MLVKIYSRIWKLIQKYSQRAQEMRVKHYNKDEYTRTIVVEVEDNYGWVGEVTDKKDVEYTIIYFTRYKLTKER